MKQRFIEQVSSNGALGLLTEGDSWFAFPQFIRTNIIELLYRYNNHTLDAENRKRAAWLRLEGNGDTAREMMGGKQLTELREHLSDPDCRGIVAGILFSAGGNDILDTATFPSLLVPREPWMNWMDCINHTRFKRLLTRVECDYETLIDLRDDFQPQAKIFTHGYDFAVPTGKPVRFLGLAVAGPWMLRTMNRFGIVSSDDQAKIMAFFLSNFDAMLRELAQRRSKIIHIRTQGTLDEDHDWGDEIHPTAQGFAKIANVFQTALHSQFPDKMREPDATVDLKEWQRHIPKKGTKRKK